VQDCRTQGEEEEDAFSSRQTESHTSAAVRPQVPRAEDQELPETQEDPFLPYIKFRRNFKFRKNFKKRPRLGVGGTSRNSGRSCPASVRPRGKGLVLGCVEHSFAETRRRHSSVSTHSEHPNQAAPAALAGHNPSCDDSDFEESSESEEEPEPDYRPPRPAEIGPRCRGTTPDHHLRCEILATQEAMERNAGHIDFVRNCQSELGTDFPCTNSFTIGSKVLAKNERLLTETLLILTAALEDIPVNLRTCDCPFKSLTKVDRDVVVS